MEIKQGTHKGRGTELIKIIPFKINLNYIEKGGEYYNVPMSLGKEKLDTDNGMH